MATVYDYEEGYTITDGLQGCRVCDEAITVARSIARDRKEPVVLEDDDGTWLVPPKGKCTLIEPPAAEEEEY